MAVSILYDVINPIMQIMVILFALALCFTLIKSFRELRSKSFETKLTGLQTAAIATFVMFALYLALITLSRVAIPLDQCPVRQLFYGPISPLARGALNYFFLVRLICTFTGTNHALSPCIVKFSKGFCVIFYSLWAIGFIATAQNNEFRETDRICVPSDGSVYVVAFLGVVVDFLFGLVLCVAFAKKLRNIQNSVNEMVEKDDPNQGLNFIKLATKQTKLAFVGWISTVVFVYGGGPAGYELPWLDVIVNLLCVYTTFGFPLAMRIHRYCCECNGNKCLLCVFCFCCTCCNESGCWCCGDGGEVEFKPGNDGKVETRTDAAVSSSGTPAVDASSGTDIVSANTETTVDLTVTQTK
eukprot:25547_1